MKRSTTRGQQGDFLRVCDRSGFTVWASDTVKEWNGLIVYKKFYEPRHPQDFLRSRRESLQVSDARPVPTPVFVGPLITETTADAAPGATSLAVVSSARMFPGDSIGVYLQNGDLHRNSISLAPTAEEIDLNNPLPGSVASGAKVINYSAVAS
jgi:hypothetical protein